MNSRSSTPIRRASPLLFPALLAAACGGGLSGTYSPVEGGFFQALDFTSGDKVQVTFMGQTREIGYQVDGKKLRIINPDAGQTQIFSIDDAGCLDGGGFIGKYCPSGAKASPGGAPAHGIAGTWESRAPGGSFRLTFAADNTVRVTVADDGGTPESQEASYEISGDRVTISAPGGVPIQLTRKGRSLEGNFGGLTMTFTQQ